MPVRVLAIITTVAAALWVAVPANAAQAYSVGFPGGTHSGAVVYWLSGKTFVADIQLEDTDNDTYGVQGYFAIVTRSGNTTFTQYWNNSGGNGSTAYYPNQRIDRPNDIMYIVPKVCLGHNGVPDFCTAENQQIDNPHTS